MTIITSIVKPAHFSMHKLSDLFCDSVSILRNQLYVTCEVKQNIHESNLKMTAAQSWSRVLVIICNY